VSLWILGIKLERRNRSRFDTSRPCVFIANHQSLIDVFIMGSVMPHRTVTVGKKSLIWIPLFGWIFWLSANLLIDRARRDKAIGTMQKAEDMVKEKGLSVIVAPEGTRSGKGGLGPFKRGAFHLAQNTKLPLQPVVISSFANLNFWKLSAGRVIVEAIEPIPTIGKSIEQMMEESHVAISAAYEKLSRETGLPN
jgi:1-acyl-sn-glycerol-3-phosphate acyltransferase